MAFSEEPKKEEEEEEEPLAGKDEEERRIAEMGRPMLGDHVKLEVIIEESYEFKVMQAVCLDSVAHVLMCSLIHALSKHRHPKMSVL